ncbi:hypothetical protein BYT27DRAFT_7079530, partial [Phlegmacium glaucopus]
PWKNGKSTKNKKTSPIEVDNLNDKSDTSSLGLSQSDNDLKSNDSDDEGDEDDNDYDAVKMTDREAREMFDDEVFLIAAGEGPAQKPHVPPHLNPKGCLTKQAIQAKTRLTRTTTSLCAFPCLLRRPKTQAVHPMVQKLKMKPGAFTIKSDDDNKTRPEDNWPKALQLRNGALMQQTDLICAVCREAIHIVEKTLVTQHAWPELHKGAHYKREVLLEAVKVLRAKNTEDNEGKQDAQYKALNTRVSNNERFVRCIGKWGCSQRVCALIENNVYVYPGHWAVDKDGKPIWMVKNSLTDIQIYLNPGLVELLKTAFFNGPTGFGYKFKEYYVSSHPDLKEPELTIPIIALGATAFFAALYEWREGKKGKMSSDSQKAKAEKFKGNNFKRVYDRHMETLMKLKKKINTYHKFMAELYLKVINGDKPDTGALIKGSALAVLDLDGLD